MAGTQCWGDGRLLHRSISSEPSGVYVGEGLLCIFLNRGHENSPWPSVKRRGDGVMELGGKHFRSNLMSQRCCVRSGGGKGQTSGVGEMHIVFLSYVGTFLSSISELFEDRNIMERLSSNSVIFFLLCRCSHVLQWVQCRQQESVTSLTATVQVELQALGLEPVPCTYASILGI